MSSGPVAERAARLASVVSGLDDPGWLSDAEVLAAAPASPGGGAPTYREVARAGGALVDALAGDGRWPEAESQARRLKAFFATSGAGLGPIAVSAWDGLLAATIARDPEETRDFVELVEELFP
jgi:hypothetical protein